MAIDPSIIGNVMAPQAPQLPDVNAMMQTRTAGMEGIYRLERQREADALAAQDRELDAAAKALAPAIASAFSDPTDEGLDAALSMVPPAYREAATAQIEQLRSIPDLNRRKDIIRAGLAQDDYGRAILAQLEPTANMRLQAATAAQRAAIDMRRLTLDEQKQALDAEGKGAWELKEGEGGFFWTNPRTREVVPANVTGTAPGAVPGAAPGTSPIPAPLPSTDLVTPRQPAPGAPQVAPPISVAQPPAEQPGAKFRPKPKKEDDLTESEAKSLDFAAQMAQANRITDELDAKGIRTSDALVSFTEALFAALPDAVGKNLAEQIRAASENLLPTLSAEEQRLARAQLQFVDAVLRSRSGAEIKTSEFPSMYRVFFPTEADENIPEIVADKKIARQLAVDTMRAKAGTRGAETLDRLLRESGVLAPAATPLTPGATVDGIEFLGAEPEE